MAVAVGVLTALTILASVVAVHRADRADRVDSVAHARTGGSADAAVPGKSTGPGPDESTSPAADYHIGDCVALHSERGGELRAGHTGCDTDAGFTVVGMADAVGDCGSAGADRFQPPIADTTTGSLCLVPNLTVGNCYRVGAAAGVWTAGPCTADPAMVRVVDRLDIADANACPADATLPARTYAIPPRTYCLGSAG